MTELEAILSSLGMGHYYPGFVNAGFDSWKTLLDITEDDLDSLAVQRGHRRRLQQEIAHFSNSTAGHGHQQANPAHTGSSSAAHPSQKRQYTRHPKADPNAPQRPLSAYVLFSNAMRDELKENTLSFADKSKIVGDRWQSMPEPAKQRWRQQAIGPWEKYKSEQMQYQTTDSHRGYQAYLAEFNASKPSKKRKCPPNDLSQLGQVDGTKPHLAIKRSSSPDGRPSSTMIPLAPAPSHKPSKPAGPSSPPSPKHTRRRGSLSEAQGSASTTPSAQGKAAQWYSHACESCKRKKVKCDGAVPTCSRCSKTQNPCQYAGGIRDKEKRLVEDVFDKLHVWEDTMRRLKPQLGTEDQSEVSRLLMMSPQTSRHAKRDSDQASHDSDSDGGESNASNVGSMGSTDHFNEEAFAPDGAGDERINAFLGQTATDNWVDRLKDNLNISEINESNGEDRIPAHPEAYSQRRHVKASSTTSGRGMAGAGTGTSMFGEHFQPYELPLKTSADSFVDTYFTTVHPSFPIISRAEFLRNYETFYSFPRPGQSSSSGGSTFVPMLHLVLAIGAVHAYVTEAPWAKDERFRLLSFARAKAAVLDASIFQATAYEQAQLCGLGGLYLLITYEINKAWNIAGLGVRCAQALGLHLTNTTPNMTDPQRNLRLGIWFSVLSLERTIAVITGRPSMVRDTDCSVGLPEDGSVNPDKHLHDWTSTSSSDPWRPIERIGSGHPFGQTRNPIPTSDNAIAPNFFVQHAKLSSLADLVLSRLYSPHIRHMKWSALQSAIRELDLQLCDWNADLPVAFHTDPSRQRPEQDPVRIAIGMLFHSTRIIINRPCLCRLADRITRQSATSDSINLEAAGRCVSSAQGILALVPNQPDPALIYHGPLWWMGFHHIKRAATVLIHEITFRSEHTPTAGEGILTDAKKAINWLHAMGTSSSPAYSSWVTLSQLLLRAAQKYGGDVSDAVIADGEDPSFALTDFAVAEGQEDQLPGSMFGMEAPDFQLGYGEGSADTMFGDLNFGTWDQFALGQGSFFPALSEMDGMMDDGDGSGSLEN